MSNIKLNCCICGKELGLGNRVSSDGVLWRCEDCARKQRGEYGNKDKAIADLEAKLAESNESHHKNIVELTKIATEKDKKIEELKQQLAEKDNALKLAREYMFKVMCADDVPSEEWFIKCAKENKNE